METTLAYDKLIKKQKKFFVSHKECIRFVTDVNTREKIFLLENIVSNESKSFVAWNDNTLVKAFPVND